MKNWVKCIFLGLVVFGLAYGSPGYCAAPQWMDATHLFEKVTLQLSQNVKLESKAEHAKRFKAPIPQPKEYKVGDVETFWSKNIQSNQFEQIQATCKAIGKNCYVFLENGRNVPDSAIKNIVNTFDEKIYPTDTKIFGSEWKPGIDGDNRIFLLLLDIKDGFNGSGGYVGGYFFAGDEFLQSQIPPQYNVKSNEKEMFYLDINPADPTSEKYMAIVAHEFQHMIHFIHDPKELVWLNESCSQIAPFFCGFGHASQISSFMQTPDNSMTAWAKEQIVANYGQVYLWNQYIVNHYLKSAAAIQDFFTTLVADKSQGTASFEKTLKSCKTDFASTFINFAITNFINDSALANGEYSYDNSLARFRLPPTAFVKTFPAQVKDKVFLWSADGIKVDLSAAKDRLKIAFKGNIANFGGKSNAFAVAAVLSDSRNAVKPQISFLKLANGVGSIELNRDKFDLLQIVVVCLGPLGVPDQTYAAAPAVPYTLDISDVGTSVARAAPRRVNPQRVVEDYLLFADVVSSRDRKISSVALSNLENLSSEMGKAVLNELETGSLVAIDKLLNAGVDEDSRANLRPLARKVAEQLDAWKLQKNAVPSNFEEKVQALKSF